MSTTLEVREAPAWGPTGQTVYERTYQRVKPNGEPEEWIDTVTRVVDGNLGLVDPRFIEEGEREALIRAIYNFDILPAGRHLWMSGVPGRQFLFNCHVSGWGERLSEHFAFTFNQLMQGGGVGANYSSKYVNRYVIRQRVAVHIVCDPEHPDYAELKSAGYLSKDYSHEWHGALRVQDSREGWTTALAELLDQSTYPPYDPHGVDWIVDVSLLRHRGAKIKTFGGTAAGPAPLAKMLLSVASILETVARRPSIHWQSRLQPLDAMEIDHAIAECVVSGNVRRSARMSIVHWNDPQIFEFIRCKTNSASHWSTNISVEIDQDFFVAIADHDRLYGAGPEEAYWNRAHRVFEAVVKGMLTNGEPGFWNSTLSNEGEPNRVVCTNPCGEIALEEWENCNLGHVNLAHFAEDPGAAVEMHRLMARFLVRATFGDVPDPKQAAVLARNRRIGVGHFGYQGWVCKQGIRFSRSHREWVIQEYLWDYRDTVREAARDYAFELRIPEPVKVTTVAPTGSIAKLSGDTEGIHPVYARYFYRRVRFGMDDPKQRQTVKAFEIAGYDVEPDIYTPNTAVVTFPTKERLVAEVEALGFDPEIVEAANEISLADMLAVQEMYQHAYADNAVSFTVNVEAEPHQQAAMAAGGWDIPEPTPERVSEVMAALKRALPNLKGTTLMVDGSRPQAPYERISEATYNLAGLGMVADSTDDECANGACPVR